MFLSALQCAFRRTLAVVLAGTLTAMSWAQTASQPAAALPDSPRPQRLAVKDYSKPNSHFPNPVGPYMARHLPPADLLNTPRIEQLLRDGKLYLSMNDAVALALLEHEMIDGAEVGRLVDEAMGRKAGGFRKIRHADGTITEVRPGADNGEVAEDPASILQGAQSRFGRAPR